MCVYQKLLIIQTTTIAEKIHKYFDEITNLNKLFLLTLCTHGGIEVICHVVIGGYYIMVTSIFMVYDETCRKNYVFPHFYLTFQFVG